MSFGVASLGFIISAFPCPCSGGGRAAVLLSGVLVSRGGSRWSGGGSFFPVGSASPCFCEQLRSQRKPHPHRAVGPNAFLGTEDSFCPRQHLKRDQSISNHTGNTNAGWNMTRSAVPLLRNGWKKTIATTAATMAKRIPTPRNHRRIPESDRSGTSRGNRKDSAKRQTIAAIREWASMSTHEAINKRPAAAKRILIAILTCPLYQFPRHQVNASNYTNARRSISSLSTRFAFITRTQPNHSPGHRTPTPASKPLVQFQRPTRSGACGPPGASGPAGRAPLTPAASAPRRLR